MDKYEYNLKIDQMKSLYAEENYESAADIADSINWNKVKNVNALVRAGEVYEKVGRYEESREILLTAYDRSPIGRMIIYRLAEVAIKMQDYDAAQEYYQEFVEIAPHDNLKYVLRYEISKAKDADVNELIGILEEFKEQEYTEEWAYELAYLYHKAEKTEKCIEACDELILWFGEGTYVERALELKMLYQPLTKLQEEKYRKFRLAKEGITTIGVEEMQRAGEYAHDPVEIPQVSLNPERFNTVNLQEEIARGMQQIMEATEKETVSDTMDNIKKIVEDIPYLQIPKEDEPKEDAPYIESDQEIDDSLKMNFQELLGEESDGQISLVMNEQARIERQITGQMSIADVLEEWERTRHAAEVALLEADQRKLESAKARALLEAEDLMDRLNVVIPKLDAGVTPKELLEEEYLGEISEMNAAMDEQIARLSSENAYMDEKLAEVVADELVEEEEAELTLEEIDALAAAEETGETVVDIAEVLGTATEVATTGAVATGAAEVAETVASEVVAGEAIVSGVVATDAVAEETAAAVEMVEEETAGVMAEEIAEVLEEETEEETAVSDSVEELEEEELALEDTENNVEEIELPEIVLPEDMVAELEAASKEDEKTSEMDENATENENVTKKVGRELTEEEKSIFSYFVPVKGMEEQLCLTLQNTGAHLKKDKTAGTGNIIIQGGQGCGKTVLATSLIKVLQLETGKLNGKIGKIDAATLNQKDIQGLLRKIAGGCLIIERAGELNRESAVTLSLLLEHDNSGILVFLEDSSKGIKKALALNESFASKFTEKVSLPIFDNDELVVFAKSYAKELGYEIDEMAILALYKRISNIQRLDQATTISEVKEIVDEAIERESKGGVKKFFSILTAKRYTDDDCILLLEDHFE